jgi:hypothetical protein
MTTHVVVVQQTVLQQEMGQDVECFEGWRVSGAPSVSPAGTNVLQLQGVCQAAALLSPAHSNCLL